jgi:hypothetical protein
MVARIVTRLFCACLIAACSLFVVRSQAQAGDTAGPYHRPSTMNGDLSYLGRKEFKEGLSRAQYTEVLLSWLVTERNSPTPLGFGLGGGPIDSLYIQKQIWVGLGTQGDPILMDRLISSPNLVDEDIRNGLRLALGLMGDKRQIPALKQLLVHDPNPRYRSMAADDLSDMDAPDITALLEDAENDPYFVMIGRQDTGTPFYPVREAARGSLRKLKLLQRLKAEDPAKYMELTLPGRNVARQLAQAPASTHADRAVVNSLVARIKGSRDMSKLAREGHAGATQHGRR